MEQVFGRTVKVCERDSAADPEADPVFGRVKSGLV